jgi:tetratricopeptide (TPR) repeat protein
LLDFERQGIRATPVALPGHVFLRLQNGPHQGKNWEPNRPGHSYTDAEYAVKYQLDSAAGRTMQELSVSQFEGLFRYELGNRLVQQGLLDSAQSEYQKALTLWQDPRIAGNLAWALYKQGKKKAAKAILDSLWNAGVRSAELEKNRKLF